jgi:DNA-binding winged helix-turn-helix (wHTH) protein
MADTEKAEQILRFGIFEADLRSGELRKNGVKVKLQEQPFQVLAMLLAHPGEVVTREELRQKLWPADTFVDFDHSLNTAINKLREALGDSASNPRFVETLARRGYRFLAPVQGGERGAPAAPPANESEAAAAAPHAAAVPVGPGELPRVNRGLARALFSLIQVMYLCFYVVSLAKLPVVDGLSEQFLGGPGWVLVALVILSAVLGIPTRLYLLSAAGFDYRGLGRSFRRLFPFVLPLDELWALSPFFLGYKIGYGLAFAATAALLYVPFSQRTLIRMAYRWNGDS